jgi:hypothetical protein
MTRYIQLGTRGELYAVNSSGAITKSTYATATSWSIAIGGAGTWYFPIGGERYGAGVETAHHSFTIVFNAALAGTFTIEGTNCAKSMSGTEQGGPDISDFDTSAAWQIINPAQAGAIWATTTGGGNSFTALTLTIGGTNAGGALINLPDMGMLRLRGKLVATAAGRIRVSANAKLGS